MTKSVRVWEALKINRMMQGDAGSDSVLNRSRWRLFGPVGGACGRAAVQRTKFTQ